MIRHLFLFFLLWVFSFPQIEYQLPLYETAISYKNEVDYSFHFSIPTYTNLQIFSNSVVRENSIHAFILKRISTNIIYNNSQIVYAMSAIDASGKHVTVTQKTNVRIFAERPSGTNLPGNLAKEHISFLSPTVPVPDEFGFLEPGSQTTPDFEGILFTNSYSKAAFLTLFAEEKEVITNRVAKHYDPVLRKIYTMDYVFTNNDAHFDQDTLSLTNKNQSYYHVFELNIQATTFFTNKHKQPFGIYLMTETTNGQLSLSENISTEFVPKNQNPDNIDFFRTNDFFVLEGINEGYALLTLSNTNSRRQLKPTNISIRVALHENNSKTFLPVNFIDVPEHSIQIDNNSFDKATYLDVRRPNSVSSSASTSPNAYFPNKKVLSKNKVISKFDSIASVDDFSMVSTSNITDAILSARENNILFFTNTFIQTGAFDSNLAPQTLLKEARITLSFSPESMALPQGFTYNPETLKIFKLQSDSWSLVENNVVIDTKNNIVSFTIEEFGIYAVGASIMRSVTSLDNVFQYPNPFKVGENSSIKFINIPKDITSLTIYSLSGLEVISFDANQIKQGNITGHIDGFFIEWDVRDKNGKIPQGGIYYFIIKTETEKKIEKFMILK